MTTADETLASAAPQLVATDDLALARSLEADQPETDVYMEVNWHEDDVAPEEDGSAPEHRLGKVRRHRRFLPAWLRRRWWLLVACLVAGTSIGVYAGNSQPLRFSASAQLVVATGAGATGPGPANDAIALALTDASIIPFDQSALNTVSLVTDIPTTEVTNNVSASVEAGTAVVLVSYTASTRAAAIVGANSVANAVTQGGGPNSAIPADSLVLVRLASDASPVGVLRSEGLFLGVLLAILAGAIGMLAIERADPRVDDLEDLARVTGTPTSAYPGAVSMVELERLIARASDGNLETTIAPLSPTETSAAHSLFRQLHQESGAGSVNMEFALIGPVSSAGAELAMGSGPTVLLVRPGTRSRRVQASVERLTMLGRAPVWAIAAEKPRRRWRS